MGLFKLKRFTGTLICTCMILFVGVIVSYNDLSRTPMTRTHKLEKKLYNILADDFDEYGMIPDISIGHSILEQRFALRSYPGVSGKGPQK